MFKQSLVAGLVAGLIVIQASAAPTPRFKPGELVFSKGVPEEFVSKVKKFHRLSGLTVVKVPIGQEIAALKRAKSEGFSAELNYIATAFNAPNDPQFNRQWNMTLMGVPAIWDTATGADITTGAPIPIKVAVIDGGLTSSGIDGDGVNVCDSPLGKDFAYGDSDPDDQSGHGTHVSGTIAQNTNNGKGVVGLAPGACIVAVKALNDRGTGGFAEIAEAITYAVAGGVQVINMSLGAQGIESSIAMDPALEAAEIAGVVVVAASGNNGSSNVISYPAIYPTVLSVGAVGETQERAYYSNGGSKLDVVAPGGNMRDNGLGIAQETFVKERGKDVWGLWEFQGTSMASPHVAALAALILSKDDTLDPESVRARIRNSAVHPDSIQDDLYGCGLINPLAALNGSGATCVRPTDSAPTARFSPLTCATGVSCTFDASGSSDPQDDAAALTYDWLFHDESAASGSSPSFTYTSAGEFLVQLTVTDTDGETGSIEKAITVSATGTETGPATIIELGATGSKTKGSMSVNLEWNTNLAVDVFRKFRLDTRIIKTATTDGTYTDSLGKGSGAFTYYVCPTGNTLSTDNHGCSNAVEIIF